MADAKIYFLVLFLLLCGNVSAFCGDGVLDMGEECDDQNFLINDGCDLSCVVENGWLCPPPAPTICLPFCGDNLTVGIETCDDGARLNGDGCDDICMAEPGYLCTGSPSVCIFVCGDGNIDLNEECDDNNNINNDGCSFPGCMEEAGYECSGVTQSVCVTVQTSFENTQPDEGRDGLLGRGLIADIVIITVVGICFLICLFVVCGAIFTAIYKKVKEADHNSESGYRW